MTTSTLTLTEFLRARLDEDEAEIDRIPDWFCTDSARGDGWGSRGDTCPICGRYMFDGTESATKDAWWEHYDQDHRRARVLAEVAAKRRIMSLSGAYDPHSQDIATLRALASVYADHQDYRQEWA